MKHEFQRGWRSRVEDGFERWGRFVLRHPSSVCLVMLGAALLLGAQIPRLEIETGTDSFLHEDDPIRIRYERFREQFGRDERIVIAVEPPEVFDPTFLHELESFHRDLENEVPKLESVTSLVNVRDTRGEGDRLVVDDLLAEIPETPEEIEVFRERVLANPLYRDLVISRDGRIAAVILETEAWSSLGQEGDELSGFGAATTPVERAFLTGEENLEIVDAVNAVVAAHDAPDFRLHTAGSPILTTAIQRMMMRDMAVYFGAAFLAIVTLLWLLLRRVWGVVLPLVSVGLPMLATLGLMAVFDTPFTIPMQIIPTFLLAVGIGYAVHVLVIFYHRFDATGDREAALVEALRHTGLPIVMTASTTAVGLVSFSMAEISPVGDFGIYAPVGAGMACLYSVVLLPSLLALIPMRARKEARGTRTLRRDDRLLVGIVMAATRRPWTVVVGAAVVALLSSAGATRLTFSHDPLSWIPPGNEVRLATEYIDAHLGGAMNLELVIDTGRENGLHEPEILRRIQQLERATEAFVDAGVPLGKTTSLVEVVEETNRALHENRDEFYTIPDSRELVAQELLLFENSGSEDLEDLVDGRFSKARFTIKAPWLDAAEHEIFIDLVEKTYRDILGPDVGLEITGLVVMMSETMGAVTRSLASSYLFAFMLITPLMMVLIGSVRGGGISMVPNLLPILMTLGLMGWAGIALDSFTLLVGCIAVGLAVDDTIHFIHHYHRHESQGATPVVALRKVATSTGQALFFTSLVLAAAFSIFAFSSMRSIFVFGMLTSFAIASAFVADITVTPALLLLTSRSSRRSAAEARPLARSGLVERLGGERGIAEVVDEFLGRVLADARLAPHFEASDLEACGADLGVALARAFSLAGRGRGGAAQGLPLLPPGRSIAPAEIDAVLRHFADTLEEQGYGAAECDESRKILVALHAETMGQGRVGD